MLVYMEHQSRGSVYGKVHFYAQEHSQRSRIIQSKHSSFAAPKNQLEEADHRRSTSMGVRIALEDKYTCSAHHKSRSISTMDHSKVTFCITVCSPKYTCK